MSLIQAIVVTPSTHVATIAAAAIAAGRSFAGADLVREDWATWLSSSFTKSVRRAKTPADFERVITLGLHESVTAVDEARAVAFAPIGYERMAKPIRRLQVAGLDLPHDEAWSFQLDGDVVPVLEINSDPAMTTGKTAAQVAHGLVAWLINQELDVITAWASAPGLSLVAVPFANAAPREDGNRVIEIVDAGLTEIDPGTATVRALL